MPVKAIVAHACAAEATFALAEMERLNSEALAALTGQHNVKLELPARRRRRRAPPGDRRVGRARRPQRDARNSHVLCWLFASAPPLWSRISIKAVLEAREGV